jgi:hypothetical protein
MPKRKIKVVFYSYQTEPGVGAVAYRGDEVDLSADEIKRGDALGAFEESPDPPEAPAPEGEAERTLPAEPPFVPDDDGAPLGGTASALSAPAPTQPDEIDELHGDDLDAAVEAAGIDPSTGGSKQDGGLTADEKRQALKDQRGTA